VNYSRRTSLTVVICAGTLAFAGLTGCSSSAGKAGSTLSKADFIAKTEAVCASTLAELEALPQPSGLTDYTNIVVYDAATLQVEPMFVSKVTSLVDQSPDKAALHRNWIDAVTAQFNAQKPYIAQLDTAAKAKDDAQITSAAQHIAALPENAKADDAVDYLNNYGLTSCASLTENGAS
jgi:hypothetical protein